MSGPKNVDAVVLVGGKGTRLRPLTISAPKPMLPTAGLPFLTHLLSRIADAGIEHVVLGTSYKAATFEAELRQVIADRCREAVPDALRARVAAALDRAGDDQS